MKETGIIFSGPSVPRIQDGSKTMTRRVVKRQATLATRVEQTPDGWVFSNGPAILRVRCPYGQPGDLLYVREGLIEHDGRVMYRADETPVLRYDPPTPVVWVWQRPTLSARFMPKWLARLWLEITDVRVERVQDIIDEDCLLEGVTGDVYGEDIGIAPTQDMRSARIYFMELWDELNAKRGYSWDSNPWVWAITFKRVEKPR